jgi:hypothetical protein
MVSYHFARWGWDWSMLRIRGLESVCCSDIWTPNRRLIENTYKNNSCYGQQRPRLKISWAEICLKSESGGLNILWWQWPRGLRHEMSSSALTMGSWVRIALKACMCLFCVCIRQRPCDGLIPRRRRPTECLRLRNWSETKRFTDVLCSKWEQQ